MDFARNKSSQQQQPTVAPQAQAQAKESPAPQFKNVRSGGGGHNAGSLHISSVFILVATALLVLALIFALIFVRNENTFNSEKDLIQSDRYQAVFLDSQDGQVYFGKLALYNSDTYILKDIYYVRVENPIQPDGGQAAQANISLAKLGNELHAPEDYMYIRKSQVLYWENLQDDGQVVNAIKEYVANGGDTDQTTQDQSTQQQATQPAGTPQQDDTPAEDPVETPSSDVTTP